eukprot:CAMPEP_0184291588 /NCGR_PEP_ID=MMETSP1049-20130417/3566_1 /TAXON_ID=77928 /ORGANISM="Proteomonas sulcata, Strain CCMP704" /LENGTH=603 /DNA_ID=CAMNT_0026599073 /DNA_START=30 /DNA_END=1841 /DNA_ORIENTATION=+
MTATVEPDTQPEEKPEEAPQLGQAMLNVKGVKASPLSKSFAVQKETDNKKTVIITGASSGIGFESAKALIEKKGWHVIMAVRTYQKALKSARDAGLPEGSYTIMNVDVGSMDSVRDFANQVRMLGRRVDAIVCNAAVWYPRDKEPRLTVDGYEEAFATNHLGHFLLCNLLLGDLPENEGRILFIGTETANDGLAGKIPPVADLGNLEGMATGMKSTIDGGTFEPTKAYKDSKVCNAIVMREMNKRYGKTRGVTINAMFPGCIAESPLFRQKRGWFRWLFPKFQKSITKQFVPMDIAGSRVADCIADHDKKVGGAYWKWNAQSGKDFERVDQTEAKEAAANLVKIPAEALDEITAEAVWDMSAALAGYGIAPEISINADSSGLTLKGDYVAANLAKGEILLRQMRKDMSFFEDQANVMEISEDLEGDGSLSKACETLYYWGRRNYAPKLSFRYNEQESSHQIVITQDKPRADLDAADVLLNGLREALPETQPAPGITVVDDRVRNAAEGVELPDPEDAMGLKVENCYMDTSETLQMMKGEMKDVLGDDSREDLKLIPRETIMQLTEEMDAKKEPPSGLGAQIFGERDSFKRLLFEAVSKGAVKN